VDYCIVISVGYAVTVMVLWEVLALLWFLYEPSVMVYSIYGPVAALAIFFLGALINCFFQAIGSALSLSPSLSITLGWSLLSLTLFLASIAASPPSDVEGYVAAVIGATQALTNSFPASKIFYDIGNLTLAVVGLS